MLDIGKKILECRQKAKMTQKEMAMKLNVSDKVISRWETGKSYPDVEMMLKISKLFDIQIQELYDNVGQTDINDNDKFDHNFIYNYIKVNIISYSLLILAPLMIYFSISYSIKENDKAIYYIYLAMFLIAVVFFVISIIIEIIQFVKLKLFIDYKYFNVKYKKILIKYSLIFLVLFLIAVLTIILVFVKYL